MIKGEREREDLYINRLINQSVEKFFIDQQDSISNQAVAEVNNEDAIVWFSGEEKVEFVNLELFVCELKGFK